MSALKQKNCFIIGPFLVEQLTDKQVNLITHPFLRQGLNKPERDIAPTLILEEKIFVCEDQTPGLEQL